MPAYREYQPGECRNCGKDLGVAGQYGGRDRKYCDGACRQAMYRKRSTEKKYLKEARMIESSLNSDYWRLDDSTMRLVARLARYNPNAIADGVEIALHVARAIRRKAEERGVFL